MKKLLISSGVIMALSLAIPAFAQTAPMQSVQRTVSVSGDSKEDVAPDQAVLSMSLVTHDKNLSIAKKNNDDMVKRLVAITKQFNIPQEKIATSGIYIAPEYDYNNGHQTFTGYTVNRSLRVTMDSLDIHEQLLSAIVDAKIDQVNGVEFQLANPESHAAPLRVKAFEDAKAKAQALAQAAGSKLGAALTISTVDEEPSFPRRPMPMMMAKASMNAVASVAPSLPGMVTLQETVTVTFALE